MPTDDDPLALDPGALAVQQRFLEEWRAGKRPRLSVYARRYPAYAAALADLVADLPPDSADPAAPAEALPESFPERLWNGAGAERALSHLFGAEPAPQDVQRLPRVAEARGHYDTPRTDGPATRERPGDD